jgi:hypothetical protein
LIAFSCSSGEVAATQSEVEVGGGERLEAALALDDDVALLWRERVDDLGAPLALDERGRVHDALEDAVGVLGQLAVAGREGDAALRGEVVLIRALAQL